MKGFSLLILWFLISRQMAQAQKFVMEVEGGASTNTYGIDIVLRDSTYYVLSTESDYIRIDGVLPVYYKNSRLSKFDDINLITAESFDGFGGNHSGIFDLNSQLAVPYLHDVGNRMCEDGISSKSTSTIGNFYFSKENLSSPLDSVLFDPLNCYATRIFGLQEFQDKSMFYVVGDQAVNDTIRIGFRSNQKMEEHVVGNYQFYSSLRSTGYSSIDTSFFIFGFRSSDFARTIVKVSKSGIVSEFYSLAENENVTRIAVGSNHCIASVQVLDQNSGEVIENKIIKVNLDNSQLSSEISLGTSIHWVEQLEVVDSSVYILTEKVDWENQETPIRLYVSNLDFNRVKFGDLGTNYCRPVRVRASKSHFYILGNEDTGHLQDEHFDNQESTNYFVICDSIDVLSETVSINEQELKGVVLVYPNPASSNVSIDMSSISGLISNVTILDFSGRTVAKFINPNKKFDFELSGLARGSYVICVEASGNRFHSKLLITSN